MKLTAVAPIFSSIYSHLSNHYVGKTLASFLNGALSKYAGVKHPPFNPISASLIVGGLALMAVGALFNTVFGSSKKPTPKPDDKKPEDQKKDTKEKDSQEGSKVTKQPENKKVDEHSTDESSSDVEESDVSDESESDSDKEPTTKTKEEMPAVSLKRSDTSKKAVAAIKDTTSFDDFVTFVNSIKTMRAEHFLVLLDTTSELAGEKTTYCLKKKDLSFFKDKSGYFPFTILIHTPSDLIYLLQDKIDPNSKNEYGETALTLLVGRKVDADFSSSKNYVPLDKEKLDLIAASAADKDGTLVPSKGKIEQTTSPALVAHIKALRDIGANPEIPNAKGKSAIDLAGNNISLLKALTD